MENTARNDNILKLITRFKIIKILNQNIYKFDNPGVKLIKVAIYVYLFNCFIQT